MAVVLFAVRIWADKIDNMLTNPVLPLRPPPPQVPADYSDVLLENWTKPSYNPIIENTQRDPSTPWKSPSGEWRLRTYDAKVYGAASDADMLAGKWYVRATYRGLL